ncbi:hypothetical protein GGI22_005317 [Coemansia erecta]|nr:hypothetical protein GGI22_005317 [Coemansia erecta]
MKYIAALLVAATAVVAQQQESNQGPNISTGSNAISNPNVNNGFQAQGSFIDGSDSGGNTIDDIMQNFGFGDGAFRRRNAILNNSKDGRFGAPPPVPAAL